MRFFSLFFQNWKARGGVENLDFALWKTLWKLCKTRRDKRLARVEIFLGAAQKQGRFGAKKRRFFYLALKVFQSAKKACFADAEFAVTRFARLSLLWLP